MQRVATGDLIRNFGTYSDSALSEPIIITKNGRERFVLLNVDDYNLLRRSSKNNENAKSERSLKRSSARSNKSSRNVER